MGSSAIIQANSITGNGTNVTFGTGITVQQGSSAVIRDNTINQNRPGITVRQAVVSLPGGNTIADNAGAGIVAGNGSRLDIGLFGSTNNVNVITSNGQNGPFGPQGGIFVFGGGSADIRNATISGNAGPGVWIQTRSFARMGGDSITNNTAEGIRLEMGSGLTMFDALVTVTGNGGFGLRCTDSESSFVGNTGGITANGAGDVDPRCSGF